MTEAPHAILTASLQLPEEEMETRMIREIDAFLGHPPRQQLDAGVTLFPEAVPPKYVAVHIVDNGPGIPPENLARVFDLRFTTRQGRVEFGLGLGLSISRNIVTRLGGTLTVESQPGCTDFCVTLPRNPPTASAPQETPP